MLFRSAFGLHLFGNADYFPDGDKFTLDPLKTDGADSLVCSDVKGLEWIRLKEIQRFWGGPEKEIETRRAHDLFAALGARNAAIPMTARLIKATFSVKFENARTPRSVTVRPPNIAMYTRNDDGPIIEDWLMKRGFAPRPAAEEDEEREAAVVNA